MDPNEPSLEQECEAIQDEIALWERQQVSIANEVQRLRIKLGQLRARIDAAPRGEVSSVPNRIGESRQ
jgi:hypothetical protein